MTQNERRPLKTTLPDLPTWILFERKLQLRVSQLLFLDIERSQGFISVGTIPFLVDCEVIQQCKKMELPRHWWSREIFQYSIWNPYILLSKLSNIFFKLFITVHIIGLHPSGIIGLTRPPMTRHFEIDKVWIKKKFLNHL